METTRLLTFLVNSLWQVPLVTAISAMAQVMMRRSPASHRHAVWVAGLAAAILLPLASMNTGQPTLPAPQPSIPAVQPAPRPTTAAAQPPAAPAAPRATPSATPSTTQRAADPILVPFAARTARVLVQAYFVFLLFRAALLLLAWVHTLRLRRTARRDAVPQPVEATWDRCRRVLGLRRVELLASGTAPGPLMTGAWRRSVIVPDALLAETSEDVLVTALGHEMAHAKRHDFSVNLLCELLYLPISFNPVAWILRRGIERTREMACDEMVTARLLDPASYARSIVTLAAAMAGPAHPGYSLGVFDGDILEERIRRVLARRVANLRQARLLLAGGLSALALCAVLTSGLALTARAQNAARPEIAAGVAAFNRADFLGAIAHFQAAVQLEPANLLAKLHLANSYVALATRQKQDGLLPSAREQYQDVLSLAPDNRSAILGLVSLAGADELPRSRELLTRLMKAIPNDPVPYYNLAVKDWMYAYPRVQQASGQAGLPFSYRQLPDPAVRHAVAAQIQPAVDEGVRMVETALRLDPRSSDSLAYLDLLYRCQAAIADDPAQADALLAKADDAVSRAIALRRTAGAASETPLASAQIPNGYMLPRVQEGAVSVIPLASADGEPALPSSMVLAPPPPPPPPPGAPGAGDYLQVMSDEHGAPLITTQATVDRLHSLGFPTAVIRGRVHQYQSDQVLIGVLIGPYTDKSKLQPDQTKLQSLGFKVGRFTMRAFRARAVEEQQ
jgi:beta-lactamase regulating signal transducer with metallopeptidase domain